MRQVRYSVAMSLDGYIAGPKGEFDWILMDPDIDFAAMMSSFDTVLMGRHSFEVALSQGGLMPGMKTVVVSRTLRQEDYPNVTIIGEEPEEAVAHLRAESGQDIWLFGGGLLFRSLLAAGLVDTVEVAVIPILLGAGKPMLPPPADRARLRLTATKVYEKTGIVALEYTVEQPA